MLLTGGVTTTEDDLDVETDTDVEVELTGLVVLLVGVVA